MNNSIEIAIFGILLLLLLNLVWYWGYQKGKENIKSKVEKIRSTCFHSEEPCGDGPCDIALLVIRKVNNILDYK